MTTFNSSIPGFVCLLVISIVRLTTTTAFQATPNGNADQPPLSKHTGRQVEEQVISSNYKATSPNSFRSTQSLSKRAGDFQSALDELLEHWSPPTSPAIGCLFVGASFAPHLASLVNIAQDRLGHHTQLLTVVGGGVVGDGRETEDTLGLSFLGGVLPENSSVKLFSMTDNDRLNDGATIASQLSSSDIPSSSPSAALSSSLKEQRRPSHLVFADPLCHEIHNFLEKTEGIVAGGISVASPNQPSLAIGTKVLPPGSLIGATFTGNIGLQVVVTQGCRPVGSTYRVTSVDGPAVRELDSGRAIDRLQETIAQLMKDGSPDTIGVQSEEFLGGIHKEKEVQSNVNGSKAPEYFILRQMTGFRPRSGSILVCGPQIQTGDFFRFHIQSKEIALGDWQATLQRAETERLFLGEQAGEALGAFQISCMGRGKSLFGIPNVDLRHVERLLPPNIPIAGLMANAEIGPVGIRMGTSETSKSVLHGFASVVAMLCAYNDSGRNERMEMTCLGNSTGTGSWE